MRVPTFMVAFPLLTGVLYPALVAGQSSVRSTDLDTGPVSIRWNRLLPKFAGEATARRRAARAAATAAGDSGALRRIAVTQPPMTFNAYPLVSVAQYRAFNLAQGKAGVSSTAAVAVASAAVLTHLYTDSAVRASIARELALDLDRAQAGPRGSQRVSAGRKIGEDVARGLIATAPFLNLATPWKGTVPTGPGMWYSAPGVPPIGIALVTTPTWLLDSASQFRPAPPPAFGSPAFDAAMEEVRRFARDRTPEHTRIAQRWNVGDPMSIWNEKAVGILRKHGASEALAARVLAVMNVANADAAIACFEAKYHYWTIRPSQVDTTLKLADSVGVPNFPAYPSGHACGAGALEGVLASYFPGDRAEFHRMAEEQAMSRLYAGVHYRFDNDVGLALGRVVARHAVDREKRGALRQVKNR